MGLGYAGIALLHEGAHTELRSLRSSQFLEINVLEILRVGAPSCWRNDLSNPSGVSLQPK